MDNLETNNELFELCKEVYEKKPGWITGDWFLQDPDGKIIGKAHPAIRHMDREWKNGYRTDVPLYTSDYLLEKLPESIKIENSFYAWLSMDNLGEDGWQFSYRMGNDKPFHKTVADTPLKSLLKLTLALHEAGEL